MNIRVPFDEFMQKLGHPIDRFIPGIDNTDNEYINNETQTAWVAWREAWMQAVRHINEYEDRIVWYETALQSIAKRSVVTEIHKTALDALARFQTEQGGKRND